MANVINIKTLIWGVMAVGDYTITREWTSVDLDNLSAYSIKSLCGDYRLERIAVSDLTVFQAACEAAGSGGGGGSVTPTPTTEEYRSVIHDFTGPITVTAANILALGMSIGETGVVVQIHLMNKSDEPISVSPDTDHMSQSFILDVAGDAREWGNENLKTEISPFSITVPVNGKLAVSSTIYIS